MSHQHSTALQDIRRHIFSSVGQIQMFHNEQNVPFAGAKLQKNSVQAEQLEMRISLFKKIQQLLYEIAKSLLRVAEDFFVALCIMNSVTNMLLWHI